MKEMPFLIRDIYYHVVGGGKVKDIFIHSPYYGNASLSNLSSVFDYMKSINRLDSMLRFSSVIRGTKYNA